MALEAEPMQAALRQNASARILCEFVANLSCAVNGKDECSDYRKLRIILAFEAGQVFGLGRRDTPAMLALDS
jgi:hypothetical protein